MRIRCTRPNASDLINGVGFSPDPAGGMISEDVSREVAAGFLGIPGYVAVFAPAAPAAPAAQAAQAAPAVSPEPTKRRTPHRRED